MFFEHSNAQFFKPLTGKYRAQVVACLSQLYRRMYQASQADYGGHLKREELLDVFYEALVQAPVLPSDVESESEDSQPRSDREQALWILNQLVDCGWIERQIDEVSMISHFHFSRVGRVFSEPFVVEAHQSHRTRHRNTRSTFNALRSFTEEKDIYDLLDAWEHSEKIISDFSEVITEIEERRNSLVKDMESQLLIQKASDEFFDFMEKRFKPDLAIKLTADGVEKHRDRILTLLESVRTWPKSEKTELERKLRQLLPDQVVEQQSVLFRILDDIEQRITAAADIVVPQLRKAIQGFTKRADVILRQLSYLSAHSQDRVVESCRKLVALPTEKQNMILTDIGQKLMAPLELGFVDPSQNRLHAPRQSRIPNQFVDHDAQVDEQARDEMHIQALLDQAFYVNNHSITRFLGKHIQPGSSIDSKDLTVDNAIDLLALSHIVEAGGHSSLSSEFEIVISPTEHRVSDEYFKSRDSFLIGVTRKQDSDQND